MKTLLLSALALFAGVSSYAQTTDKKEIISVWSEGHRIAILQPDSITFGSKIEVPEAVDLGLSVKWASFNLGAVTPEASGDFYAWAEIAPKSYYDWSTYYHGVRDFLTKYNATDKLTQIEPSDDAATRIFGEGWQIATEEQFKELLTKCTWTTVTINDIPGFEVKGENGNSIFIPYTGTLYYGSVLFPTSLGSYWTSTLDTEYNDQGEYFKVRDLTLSSEPRIGTADRCWGRPIRAVYTK